MPKQVEIKEETCVPVNDEASIAEGTVVSSVASTIAIDEDELRKLRKINIKRKITGKYDFIN